MKFGKACPSLKDISEQPIRGQIFSAERLEEYAIYMAENLLISIKPKVMQKLLPRLADSSEKLATTYEKLIKAVRNKESVSPAAEWLIDNFHIVEDQIREIKNDLPGSYYKELPKVSLGELAGYPRIYALALAIIAHSDSRLEVETIRRFIQAFQRKTYLNIGELWAVPITLRLALVENARRIAVQVMWDLEGRSKANHLADEIIEMSEKEADLKKVISKIPLYCGQNIELEYAFIAQLVKRLRDQSFEIWPASECLEKTLAKSQFTTEQIVNLDHQRQAANQISIANIIFSMRLLSNINWQLFFESVSLIDRTLAQDPSGAYLQMDFVTRNHYRETIESIGKRTLSPELTVAEKAVELSRDAKNHVGEYLIGGERPILEKQFSYQLTFFEFLQRMIRTWPGFFYIGSFFCLVILTEALPFYYSSFYSWDFVSAVLLFVILFIPCSDFAVSVLNYFVTHSFKPDSLPKMDFQSGVPDAERTLVVIPCMLFDLRTIHELLNNLEVHFLGNTDKNICFALLTDYVDADKQSAAGDDELLQAALKGLEQLNGLYCSAGDPQFYLFHRKRLWNPAEKKWMGWERKRGKLEELNRVLRGDLKTSYIEITCPMQKRSTFKYVITLDADTQLGRDTAKKLIGTAAHPLNRPQIDKKLGRVTAGYGIIQPRISISLESSASSIFAKIFSSNTGIDPYTTAVSDVYQDLFREGSFTGKGLYDIDAFQECLSARVPENLILSHDLLEGLYARVALATDIELLDSYPKTYRSFYMRQHRWVRGDWQIGKWIFHRSLPLYSRWKIYDNLRRSLVPASFLLLLILGWCWLPGRAYFWTFFTLVLLAAPYFLHIAGGIFLSPRGIPWTSNFWSEVSKFKLSIFQYGLSLIFLAHQSVIQCDAIVRALYRMGISKEKCLEWTASAQIDISTESSKKALWQSVWPVQLLVLLILVVVALCGSTERLLLATPFLFLWGVYPVVASWMSRSPQGRLTELGASEKRQLAEVGRRIWHFFETYVDSSDNWLPPDNVQEDPELVVAHRTSPTNIGLYALSILAAYDCGYLTVREVFEKLRNLMDTVKRLEKFEGHLLNWYDTQTLTPLEPRYVSTVDSGNLAGYLLVVKQACVELKTKSLFSSTLVDGIKLTFLMIEQEILRLKEHKQGSFLKVADLLNEKVQECQKLITEAQLHSLTEWSIFNRFLKHSLEELGDAVKSFEVQYGPRYFSHLKSWVDANVRLVEGLSGDFDLYAPWTSFNFKNIESELSGLSADTQEAWQEIMRALNLCRNLEAYPEIIDGARDLLGQFMQRSEVLHLKIELLAALESLDRADRGISFLMSKIGSIDHDVEVLFREMNFAFLMDPQREVFHIGYNVREGRHDNSYYDLLASESRLASFVAIAKGDASQRHWFRLGRQLVPVDGSRALISWSASMFEYLMPMLVMKNFESTLLNETMQAVVKKQIRYGHKLKVPWGISEAGYNARDLEFNYQYGPFGIPGLGLKRGLGHDLVVSPYSTFLAAMVDPKAACVNLKRLEKKKILSCFGFYEAIDFTPERLIVDQKYSVIKSYMAHHQGMSLVAITNVLHRNIMPKRFHADLRVRATQLLLQERVPHQVELTMPKTSQIEWENEGESLLKSFMRVYENPNLATPRVQLLSNGEYSLMLTSAGGGYSTSAGKSVGRWREDGTRDPWGSFIFVRDLQKKLAWSVTYAPLLKKPETYKVTFKEDKVSFLREDEKIRTLTEVIVAPEDNLEIRHLAITNDTLEEKWFEVTSYLEVVLAGQGEDQAHPAFSNLFVQTEYLASRQALIAKRRPRSSHKPEVWGFQSLVVDEEYWKDIEYETDRAKFIGRGRNLKNALALEVMDPLAKSLGSTLDPIFCLRVRIHIPPGGTKHLKFNTGLASSRDEVLQIVDRYHDTNAFERESRLAWTKAQIDLRHLGLDSEAAYLFQRLAERIIYVDPSLRQPSYFLAEFSRDQSSLWPYGISGDLPIVTLNVSDLKDMGLLKKLLRGHEYLRMKGLSYDFVILNESRNSYLQELQEEIHRQIRFTGAQGWLNKSGGIFVLKVEAMPLNDRFLIKAMARVTMSSEWGSLKEQVSRRSPLEKERELIAPPPLRMNLPQVDLDIPDLKFFNGLGGFTEDGKEYLIILKAQQWTPAPWINVVANAHDFGFQVSESGAGFTWSINSRENRLTTWSNDPVSDPVSEVIYIRDEESGEIWTPTPLPIRNSETYIVRHGQGYSTFEHNSQGFKHALTLYVCKEDPVKIIHLRLKNISHKPRKISVTGFVEWVLGNQRDKSATSVHTEFDRENGIVLARNTYNQEFAHRRAFFACSDRGEQFTCDRKEFLGRNGDYDKPDGLRRRGLNSRTGAGLDPCGVLQIELQFDDQQEREIVFILGQAERPDQVLTYIQKYRDLKNAEVAFIEIQNMWEEILSVIQVKTPDESLNLLMNRWILYQSLSCRMWARSAFYQSGGAFGFRDQLQDCMAFVYAQPELAKKHILLAASRQFLEGDVQHWWHPPSGRGVRTHFSDDLLWLPFVVCHYIKTTGDTGLLQEKVPFIEAPLLKADQEDAYLQPKILEGEASLLDHCLRAIEKSLPVGAHGLPLIGSGDWNDGMNCIGEKGQGESVWMAWFLYKILNDFLPFCDDEHRQRYSAHLRLLKESVEHHAWDGHWYRRAFFDDGTPLGSVTNTECQIDSLSQSWSILSGAGEPLRQQEAMKMVANKLIRWEDRLVQLLTPPFDKTSLNPGYIKGYVPGVRENGGQYTHAAIWVAMAFAELGDGEMVHNLFSLLNPLEHARDLAGVKKYKVEPYVISADVYAVDPHVGRGGWSWYTGSASWYYRLGIESLLGFHLERDHIHFRPCVPKSWTSYSIKYLYKSSPYELNFERADELNKGSVVIFEQGQEVSHTGTLQLLDDGLLHRIQVRFLN